jgi:hypothetical protein
VGSKTFDGVRFAAYVNDHLTPHVHAFYGGIEAVLEINFASRRVRLSRRRDNPRPENAKLADARRIVKIRDKHILELIQLWESAR